MENNILQPNYTTCKFSSISSGSPETESKNDIIVRDYAYPSSFPSSTPAPCLHRIPEIFNQYEGLAEVEYRWTQSRWMYPVPGKILSRLLEMGWITEEEIRAHASPMDLVELRKHNARLPYPWKPLGSTRIPENEDRKALMLTRASDFQQRDAARAMAELKETTTNDRVHKRRTKKDSGTDSGTNPKKRRKFPAPPQLKQYPAPLHAYNPNVYPELAFPTVSPASSNPPSHRPLEQQTILCDDDKTDEEKED
jgi:hypothetical protein